MWTDEESGLKSAEDYMDVRNGGKRDRKKTY